MAAARHGASQPTPRGTLQRALTHGHGDRRTGGQGRTRGLAHAAVAGHTDGFANAQLPGWVSPVPPKSLGGHGNAPHPGDGGSSTEGCSPPAPLPREAGGCPTPPGGVRASPRAVGGPAAGSRGRSSALISARRPPARFLPSPRVSPAKFDLICREPPGSPLHRAPSPPPLPAPFTWV